MICYHLACKRGGFDGEFLAILQYGQANDYFILKFDAIVIVSKTDCSKKIKNEEILVIEENEINKIPLKPTMLSV